MIFETAYSASTRRIFTSQKRSYGKIKKCYKTASIYDDELSKFHLWTKRVSVWATILIKEKKFVNINLRDQLKINLNLTRLKYFCTFSLFCVHVYESYMGHPRPTGHKLIT